MKKVFLIMSALCCLLAAPAIRAQNLNEWAPNEISASYGVSLLGSSINTLIDLAGTFSRVAEADAPTIKSGGSRGILNIGYIHHTNRFVGFGANAGFNRMSVNLEDNTGKISAASANIIFLMAEAKFNWFRRPVFGMYSKIGLGAMCINGNMVEQYSGNLWLPTGQLSLIGMEVGEQFCGFMELGAGMQGIAQFGLKYHF